MSLREFFGTLIDRLKETAQVRTVYGEPLRLEDRTLVPVAKSSYGFGSLPERGQSPESETGTRAGGAVSTTPMGVLEVGPEGTRFIAIPDNNPAKIVAAFAAGMVLGGLLVARGRRRPEIAD